MTVGAMQPVEIVLQMATTVLGSLVEAERWLYCPAMVLDQRKPVDLLWSDEGTAAVIALLIRMDYGVYT